MEGMWYLNGFAEAQPTKSKSIFNSMPALFGPPWCVLLAAGDVQLVVGLTNR